MRVRSGPSRIIVACAALTLAASASCTRDGGTAAGDSARLAQDGSSQEFVGAEVCAKCHSAEYDKWKSSQHAVAMQIASPAAVLGRFDSMRIVSGKSAATFVRRGTRYFVKTHGDDGALHDFEIHYTFGVWPLQQYLVDFPRGRVQALPVAWDARPPSQGGQRWFWLADTAEGAVPDEFHWTGRAVNWNYMCADCHATDVRKGYDAVSDSFHTTWSEMDVACEACHGPGARHVRWARYPRWLRRIVWRDDGVANRLTERTGVRWARDAASGLPVRSVPRTTSREIRMCAQCHSRRVHIADGYTAGKPLLDYYDPLLLMGDLYHPDGQQRDEVYTWGSFLQSRMYSAGVTCADCHDPHAAKPRFAGNQLCTQCHDAARYDTSAHHFHAAGGPGAQCVSCHMRTDTFMQIDPRHDHSLRVPRPDQSVSMGVPNACNDCHRDRDARWAEGMVERWYGAPAAGFQRFADAFDADDRRLPAAADALLGIASDLTQPEIVRASAVARLAAYPDVIPPARVREWARDTSALMRRAALEVVGHLGVRDQIAIAAPLLEDSLFAIRREAAWVLSSVADSLQTAAQRHAFARAGFVESQRYNADRADARVLLGTYYVNVHQLDSAAAEYAAAIQLAPHDALARINLSEVFRMQGQAEEAEQTLRDGIAKLETNAELHHALGVLLARSGHQDEALRELQRAFVLAPYDAEIAYAYAVVLRSAGRSREAIRALEGALREQPDDASLLYALVYFTREAGDRAAARRWADRLVRAFPGDAAARALRDSLMRTGGG